MLTHLRPVEGISNPEEVEAHAEELAAKFFVWELSVIWPNGIGETCEIYAERQDALDAIKGGSDWAADPTYGKLPEGTANGVVLPDPLFATVSKQLGRLKYVVQGWILR